MAMERDGREDRPGKWRVWCAYGLGLLGGLSLGAALIGRLPPRGPQARTGLGALALPAGMARAAWSRLKSLPWEEGVRFLEGSEPGPEEDEGIIGEEAVRSLLEKLPSAQAAALEPVGWAEPSGRGRAFLAGGPPVVRDALRSAIQSSREPGNSLARSPGSRPGKAAYPAAGKSPHGKGPVEGARAGPAARRARPAEEAGGPRAAARARRLDSTRPAFAPGGASAGRSRRWAPDFDGRNRGPNRRVKAFVSRVRSQAVKIHAAHASAPQRRKRERLARAVLARFRPPSLSRWLGAESLKPPQGRLRQPDFARLEGMIPARSPDGTALDPSPPGPEAIERLSPPDSEGAFPGWRKDGAKRRQAHWHAGGSGAQYLHAGPAWGRAHGGHWTWLVLQDRRWWALAGDGQPLLRHGGAWWWRTPEGWFLLHQGEPWGWKFFPDWKREGLIHPASGTRVVYSEDGSRVAVVTPGSDWAVFDARTGGELARGRGSRRARRRARP
jgi:hypothetical protein